MTTPETKASDTVRLEPCEVTQEDREFAWRFRPDCFTEDDRNAWMNGVYDDQRVIQAIFRHRLNTRPLSIPKGEEVERIGHGPWSRYRVVAEFNLETEYGDCFPEDVAAATCDALKEKFERVVDDLADIGAVAVHNSVSAEHGGAMPGASLSTKAPAQGDVERMRSLAKVGREHLQAGNIDDALTAFNLIQRNPFASMSPTLSLKDEAWLPIEKAPRDGSYMLLRFPGPFHDTESPGIAVGKAIDRDGGWWLTAIWSAGTPDHAPDAWMPLPGTSVATLSRLSPTSEVVEKVKAALGELEVTHDYHLGDNPGHRFPIPHEISREYKAGIAKVRALLESLPTTAEGEKARIRAEAFEEAAAHLDYSAAQWRSIQAGTEKSGHDEGSSKTAALIARETEDYALAIRALSTPPSEPSA